MDAARCILWMGKVTDVSQSTAVLSCLPGGNKEARDPQVFVVKLQMNHVCTWRPFIHSLPLKLASLCVNESLLVAQSSHQINDLEASVASCICSAPKILVSIAAIPILQ